MGVRRGRERLRGRDKGREEVKDRAIETGSISVKIHIREVDCMGRDNMRWYGYRDGER